MFLVLVATDNLPFTSGDSSGAPVSKTRANRFDGPAAFQLLKLQLSYGPRPAGSKASRRLAARCARCSRAGASSRCPAGCATSWAPCPAATRGATWWSAPTTTARTSPASWARTTARAAPRPSSQLARQLKPRTIGPTVKFVLFDGEETPRGVPDDQFLARGLRGSKVAARKFKQAEAMVLLDFVADSELSLPREGTSNTRLWSRLRAAAGGWRRGALLPGCGGVGHLRRPHPVPAPGRASIDLIDFDFACFHQTCDDLSAVSERSVDASGETVLRLLASL